MKKVEILFTDLDGTLINALSGETFPKGIWDMKINFDVLDAIKNTKPVAIFIITNQGGIESGFVNQRNFDFKIRYLIYAIKEYLNYDCIVDYIYCCTNNPNSIYRKPNIGMVIKMLKRHKTRLSMNGGYSITDYLMIGDASGLEGQFSDSDKKTAEKAGMNYLDVNEFIKLYKDGQDKD